MKKFSFSFLLLSISCSLTITPLKADDTPSISENQSEKEIITPFESFTGKITKQKVRLRLQPTFDGQILKELNTNDMVVVLGETEDFYAIQPPSEFKAYVYRTFVLDNVIEGNRVNVRLKPDLDAPVLAQLTSGTVVTGSIIEPGNNKWLSIKMPENVRFYVAKEYVNKLGDAGLMARLEEKRENVNRLLHTTEVISKAEMAKPFDQINLNGIKANYQTIILDYQEFPDVVIKAKENLIALQEEYTNKKLAFVEAQSFQLAAQAQNSKKLNEELNAHKSKIAYLEQQIANQKQEYPIVVNESKRPTQMPLNMSVWLPAEERAFLAWSQNNGNGSFQDFYNEQQNEAFVLRGVIQPYPLVNKPGDYLKNKPGDYMLISSASKMPIAFLYSTQINLQDFVGHDVSIRVTPRPNNNFAFPAYFVLSFE